MIYRGRSQIVFGRLSPQVPPSIFGVEKPQVVAREPEVIYLKMSLFTWLGQKESWKNRLNL